MKTARSFLKAEWRKLAMANYEVSKELLLPYLPARTELDVWNGAHYVSLVGFMFVNTRIKGVRIPLHTTFEEVNLRFYVRYNDGHEWKRGVVFIKEIVPRRMLTFVANRFYKENYETLPMRHMWQPSADSLTVEYAWKKSAWNSFQIVTDNVPFEIAEGSEEEFITEHYWGYTKTGVDKTSEYGVEHPRWKVYSTRHFFVNVDFGDVYGSHFSFLDKETPKSVFLAEGSEICVRHGRVI